MRYNTRITTMHACSSGTLTVQIHKYICMHIYLHHEVKNQRALAKRTSRIMKYGQDVAIQKGQM